MMPGHSAVCTLADMLAIAGRLAEVLRVGDVVVLSGAVGSGKTTFAGGVIRAIMGHHCAVVSPTYQVVRTYSGGSVPVAHVDLYRIKSAAELVDIGIADMLDDYLMVIEWPNIALNILGNKITFVDIMDGDDIGTRKITLGGHLSAGDLSKILLC